MQIAISIEPYLVVEKIKLIQYIEDIIQISSKFNQKQKKVLIHFDYFKSNPDVFTLVQNYTDQIEIDLHLMQEPAKSVEGFRSVSLDVNDWLKKMQQTENSDPLVSSLQSIETARRGLVFDLGATIDGYENLIRETQYIIVMTVKCGKSGQIFQPSALALIPQIRQLNPKATIIVDGGVNESNFALLKEAGVDVAVIGNYAKKCYESGELEKGINRLLRI